VINEYHFDILIFAKLHYD